MFREAERKRSVHAALQFLTCGPRIANAYPRMDVQPLRVGLPKGDCRSDCVLSMHTNESMEEEAHR
jgi:hypothetical protein